MRKLHSKTPQNERVFEEEQSFLEAKEEIRRGCQPFVLSHTQTGKKYYVWGQNKTMAHGLLARHLNFFTSVTLKKAKNFSKFDATDIEALLATLPPKALSEIREKMRAIACPYCSNTCKSRRGLTSHKKTKHKAEYQQELRVVLVDSSRAARERAEIVSPENENSRENMIMSMVGLSQNEKLERANLLGTKPN